MKHTELLTARLNPRTAGIWLISLLTLDLTSCKKDEPCNTCPNEADTTSHVFAWSTTTLGGGGGSTLYNVGIVNDSLAYAVGEVYLRDSMGQLDPVRYNLAVWNGQHWSAQRLPYNYQGQVYYNPIHGILVFSSNNIWFCGNGVSRWNGYFFVEMPVPSGVWGQDWMNCVWGTSSSDIYIAGAHGALAHYDANGWQRIETGTALDIRDMWGAPNPSTGQPEILAVASNDVERRLLTIQGLTVTFPPDSGLSSTLDGLWFVPNQKYYVVGAGIHYKNFLDNSIWSRYAPGVVTNYASSGVRGNSLNDVFVVGSFYEVVHFNGASWHNYRDEIPPSNGALGRLAMKGNLVIAVGLSGQNAVAIVGKR